jgi:serine acetyltransferase
MKKRPLIFIGHRNKINELAWTADRLGHKILGVLDHQFVDQPSKCSLPVLGDERILLDANNQQAQKWLAECDFFVGTAFFGAEQATDDSSNLEILRYRRINLLDKIGAQVANLIDPKTEIEQRLQNQYCTDLKIGKGIYISWNSDIQPLGVTLGDYCSLETGSFVGHGSIIGRNVSLMPFSLFNRGTIGDNTCIGMQAKTSKPGHYYTIGKWSTICYNSVINQNVPDNSMLLPSGAIKSKKRSLDQIDQII